MGVLDNTELSDKSRFLAERGELFRLINSGTHELLAQSITWLLLDERLTIRKTFEDALRHQPSEYDLSPQLRENLSKETMRPFLSLLHLGRPPGSKEEPKVSAADLKNTAGIRSAFEQPAGS